MTARLTVLYGRDADAHLVARDASNALEGMGYHASVGPAPFICIVRRYAPFTCAAHMEPGQQLVVTHDGWRIEDAETGVAA